MSLILRLFLLIALLAVAVECATVPATDHEPPVIESTSYPSSVVAGSTFTIYLTMTDESTIIAGDTSYMRVTTGNYCACVADELKLVNGTSNDGVFSLSCVVPTTAPNGEYNLEIHISDEYSNQAGLNIPKAFVLTGGSDRDRDPPKVTSLTLSDKVLDRGQTLVIDAHAVDKQTGVQSVSYQVADSYFTYIVICRGQMTLVKGDGFSGDWSASCTIPADADYTWYTVSVMPSDGQNNQGYATATFQVLPAQNIGK